MSVTSLPASIFNVRKGTGILLVVLCLLASGCASVKDNRTPPPALPFPDAREPLPLVITPHVVGYDEYRDPLIYLNRTVFAFNDITYRYALIPLSSGYMRYVPRPVRRGINNFFHNLGTPISGVNHILQGRFKKAGRNVARFALNTTVGIGGLFDPALHWFDLPREVTGFDETLTVYGVGYGCYLVLPFMGPSSVRGGLSTLADYLLHPVPYLTEEPATILIRSADFFQDYAPDAEHYDPLRRQAEDPYLFYRNLYLQRILRDAEYR